MKLHFDDIGSGKSRYIIEDASWYPAEEIGDGLAIVAEVVLQKQDATKVVVAGKVNGLRRVACDRCGELTETPLACEFRYLVTTDEDPSLVVPEQECGDDQAQILYLAGSIVDVDEILREQVLLAAPLKNLCDESCRGICAGCGVSLNNDVCRCSSSEKNGAFAVLRTLRKK